jgi:hypothetical protein
VFRQIHGAVDALTTISDVGYGRQGDSLQLKRQIEMLIEAGSTRVDVVRALVERLFPAAQQHIGGSHYGSDWKGQWLRNRRVAHEDILLETYEDQFGPGHVVPGAVVLLNLLPDLPKRQRGMFDFGSRLVVRRVVYRLVRSLKDPDAIETAVREILPQVNSLSSRLELITMVGYQEGLGHKLISEVGASSLERDWREAVRKASVSALVQQEELLRTLLFTKRGADSTEPTLEISDSPHFTLALLRSARSEAQSQTMGSRAVRKLPRLAWDELVELYGDEEAFRERIEKLKASQPEGDMELFQLVDKYLSGWRPTKFTEE